MGDFWNPKNETMPKEELNRLKLFKLKRHCEWALEKSAFHRRKFEEAGFHPDQLKSIEDLRRIPFMTRAEWMDCQADKPLFGELVVTTTPTLVVRATTDAKGEILSADIAGGMGPFTLFLQAAYLDAAQPGGIGVTNVIEASFLP